MRAKELLEEIRNDDLILKVRLEELERLKRLCEISGISFEGEKVQTSSNPQRTSNALIEYIQVKDDFDKFFKEALEKRKRGLLIVESIKNKKCIKVIYNRYFHNMKFEEIATKTGYSIRRVYQLHNEGLDEINELLQ